MHLSWFTTITSDTQSIPDLTLLNCIEKITDNSEKMYRRGSGFLHYFYFSASSSYSSYSAPSPFSSRSFVNSSNSCSTSTSSPSSALSSSSSFSSSDAHCYDLPLFFSLDLLFFPRDYSSIPRLRPADSLVFVIASFHPLLRTSLTHS